MTALPFSSNETATLERTVEVDEIKCTPDELVPEKYDLQKCITWIQNQKLERVSFILNEKHFKIFYLSHL